MEPDKKPTICTCHKFDNSDPAKVCAMHYHREPMRRIGGFSSCTCGRVYSRSHKDAHFRAYHNTKGDAA